MTYNNSVRNAITSLVSVGNKHSCRVISISGGQTFRSKMHQLGIHGAEEVQVIKNSGSGPLVIEAGGTRLIIGRSMAERIFVSRQ